jgi:hypothetical protein
MPEAQCVRFEIGDPSERNGLFGHSSVELFISYKCECNNFGRYQISFKGKTINEKIEVFQSVWRYNFLTENLSEFCWGKEDLQDTYYHETKHIKNARYKADNIGNFALTITYDTKEKEYKIMKAKWDEWYIQEQLHRNPESPAVKLGRYEYPCK